MDIESLKQLGYDPVYVWSAAPNEEEVNHTHAFDTHLEILQGEIEITMDGERVILKPGDEFSIPRQKVHAAKVGVHGCKYFVAEKHRL